MFLQNHDGKGYGQSCGECYFALSIGKNGQVVNHGDSESVALQCRVNSPQLFMIPAASAIDPRQVGIQQVVAYPQVNPEDPGCGMFVEIEEMILEKGHTVTSVEH